MTRSKNSASTSDMDAFRASRIFAQGWNAARTRSGAVNPYASEPERSRWDEGFAKALA